MTKKKKTLDVLLGEPQGIIVACNIVKSIDDGLVDEHTVKELMDWWFSLYESPYMPERTDIEKLLDALHQTVFEPPPLGFRKGEAKPEFSLQCRIRERKASRKAMCNTTSPIIFNNFIVHDENSKALTGYRVPSVPADETDPGIRCAMKLLMDAPEDKLQCRLKHNGTLGRPNKILWFTEQPSLPTKSKTADWVRDQLGLVHLKSGESLIMITIPPECTRKAGGRRPSFMDATSHARFRVRADAKNRNKRKTWGHAVNLRKFAKGHRYIDGGCERVCRSVTAHDVDAVAFKYLGQLTTSRGEKCDDHVSFAERMLGDHDVSELRKRIEKLL